MTLEKTSPKAKKLEYRVAKSFLLDLQPLSVVEDEGFKELLAEAEPRYSVPCRHAFRNVVLPNLYNKCADKLKTVIRNYRKQYGTNCLISITTDVWTSATNISYMSHALYILS